MRNDLPDDERELLSRELLAMPTSRVYAAVSEGLPLDLWAQLKLTSLVASALGEKLEAPGSKPSTEDAGEGLTQAEVQAARTRLRRHSVIADLPEE